MAGLEMQRRQDQPAAGHTSIKIQGRPVQKIISGPASLIGFRFVYFYRLQGPPALARSASQHPKSKPTRVQPSTISARPSRLRPHRADEPAAEASGESKGQMGSTE
jgi:hypothetical protein